MLDVDEESTAGVVRKRTCAGRVGEVVIAKVCEFAEEEVRDEVILDGLFSTVGVAE